MFARRIRVEYAESNDATGEPKPRPMEPCPIAWIDNFAMRNFTNDAIFDDTLPLEDGLVEIGNRVPLDRLRTSMEDWFRRKGYLKPPTRLRLTELPQLPAKTSS
jgi:hypothetical protein